MDSGSSCQLGGSLGGSLESKKWGVRGCRKWLTYAVCGDFWVPNRIWNEERLMYFEK